MNYTLQNFLFLIHADFVSPHLVVLVIEFRLHTRCGFSILTYLGIFPLCASTTFPIYKIPLSPNIKSLLLYKLEWLPVKF